MALQLWTIGLMLSCFMLIAIDNYNVKGIAQRGANKEVSKIKCKEHVDEALRQYWDHEKRASNEVIDNENDDNDDNDGDSDDYKVKYSKSSDEDDNDSKEIECDEQKESDEKSKEHIDDNDDNDDEHTDDDDNDDDDDTDDDSEENKLIRSEEITSNQSDEEIDENNDSKEDIKSDKQDNNDKSADEDDDNDDDNDDDDDDDDDDKQTEVIDKTDRDDKKKKRFTMTISYSKDTKLKVKPRSIADRQKSKEIGKHDEESEESDHDNDDDNEDKSDSNKKNQIDGNGDDDDDDDDDEHDIDENISDTKKIDKSDESDENKSYEIEEQIEKVETRPPSHVEDILRVYEIGSQEDSTEQNLILSIFRELKKIYETAIKPLELIYKYRHITTRLITISTITKIFKKYSDAELFSKPMVLFLGSKSTGKTSLVNYVLGIDNTAWQLKTGLTRTYPHFTLLSYGENYTRFSPTELSADFTFSSLQQFGQHFLEQYIEAYRLPINLLQKMTIIDSPGLIDVITKAGSTHQPKGIDNEVYQWFIDRSDVIYIVIDVTQLHLSHQLQAIIEQLRGREVRFILSKSDVVSHSQLITMLGQLLWILSPIMSAERPPQVYALTTIPQEVLDPFLEDQEVLWLKDLSEQISGIFRIESRVAALRRHAVRVRNHAKLVDCYLATYYKNKGIFTFGASSRQLATDITENPHQYRIFSGTVAGLSQNISRYDLPDPGVYKEFFRTNPLFDFKPLTSTCSYFRGCPIDKLDIAIAYQLPELVGKYKKLTQMQPIV